MDHKELYKKVDREIEKLVFLFNAQEGNMGLYDLIWELGGFDLSIEDKYAIATEILKELLTEQLVLLVEYRDSNLETKIKNIEFTKIESIINNPISWYLDSKPK